MIEQGAAGVVEQYGLVGSALVAVAAIAFRFYRRQESHADADAAKVTELQARIDQLQSDLRDCMVEKARMEGQYRPRPDGDG